MFTASSHHPSCSPARVRIDTYNDFPTAWCTAVDSPGEWLQMDLLSNYVVRGVLIKKRFDGQHSTEAMTVKTSSDGNNWYSIITDQDIVSDLHLTVTRPRSGSLVRLLIATGGSTWPLIMGSLPWSVICVTMVTGHRIPVTQDNRCNRAWALMQWLKLPAWKVGNRGFKPHYGLQVSKKILLAQFSLCLHRGGIKTPFISLPSCVTSIITQPTTNVHPVLV